VLGAVAERFDFFLSRRGSVAAVAQEVADVLAAANYRVIVQDYDIPLGASFVEAMHEGIKNARDLIVLFSGDYEQSPYTRKEFTSFEAERLQDERGRHIVVLRCEDAPLRGLLADVVYQDLVGVADPEERKHRILAAAERRSSADRPQRRRGRTFVGVPPRIAGFTGRVNELDRLDAVLTQKRPAAVTQVGRAAVQGMGGVGKTTLAVEYSNRFRNLYDGVWWCPAETRTSLVTSLAALAKELGVAPSEETEVFDRISLRGGEDWWAAIEKADVEMAAKAALRWLNEQGDLWLLIYDNIASPDALADLLPGAGARVLITSRFSDWSGWADEVSVDVLQTGEAVAYLMERAARSDEVGAHMLAEALGRLPLALDHAGAACKRTGMSFADYVAKASSLMDSAPRGAPYPRSVAATFSLAIDDAVKQRRPAEDLMAFLAFCAPDRIPIVLVEGAIDDESERLPAIAALAETSLVKHDPFEDGAPALTVHRLVQTVARARAKAKGMAHVALTHLITQLAVVYPVDGYNNPASWPHCAQLTPHLLASCEADIVEAAIKSKCADLLERAAGYFYGRGLYSEARLLLDRALAITEKAFGPEHPEVATRLNNLALLLRYQGDHAAAQLLLDRALAINEKALGPEHPHTATTLDNLASLLQAQGDLVKAQPLFERALAINENVFGPEHRNTGMSLNNLALLVQAQGDLAKARPLFERALAVTEKPFGPEHPETANGLNSLAVLLQAQGDLPKARPLFERALAIREKTLGPEHPFTAESLNNLADLLHAQGDLAKARPLFERALVIREKALGPEHPETAITINGLARLFHARGDLAKARPLFERALAIREKALGPKHLFTAESLNNLASLHYAQGNFVGARPLFERALAIREKALGSQHFSIATTLNNLANLLRDEGNPAGARPLFERALTICEKALGLRHPTTELVRNNLAALRGS
jgi:tetratricopeptide (TPR) repeat protein